jgi:hypothetical protein
MIEVMACTHHGLLADPWTTDAFAGGFAWYVDHARSGPHLDWRARSKVESKFDIDVVEAATGGPIAASWRRRMAVFTPEDAVAAVLLLAIAAPPS